MNLTEDIKAMLAAILDQTNTFKSSPTQKDSPKPPDPTTVYPDNIRSPPLYGGTYTKIGGMWTLKHTIRSLKFYELLIKTKIKLDTAMDLKKFYNHIKISLNAVTILQ